MTGLWQRSLGYAAECPECHGMMNELVEAISSFKGRETVILCGPCARKWESKIEAVAYLKDID